MGIFVKEVKRIENAGSVVREDKDAFNDFMTFPRQIYAGNEFWVEPPMFDEKKVFNPRNPFFEHGKMACYNAYLGSQQVGRIAAIIDGKFNQYHAGKPNEPGLDGKVGFFGFFESINDADVAKELIKNAERVLRYWGAISILGPMEPSLNRKAGFLVTGEEVKHGFHPFESPPMIYMSYNPEYYQNLVENLNFKKIKDLLALKLELKDIGEQAKRMAKLTERLTRQKSSDGTPLIRVRGMFSPFNGSIKRDIEIFGELYNSSWIDNWGFTPLSDREIKDIGRELALFSGPNLIYLAETYSEEKRKYEPAGFLGALPNHNLAFKDQNGKVTASLIYNVIKERFRPSSARITFLGIKPEHRENGLIGILFDKIFKMGYRFNIKNGELSWILEDNLNMLKPLIKNLFAQHYKTYRLYQKPIS